MRHPGTAVSRCRGLRWSQPCQRRLGNLGRPAAARPPNSSIGARRFPEADAVRQPRRCAGCARRRIRGDRDRCDPHPHQVLGEVRPARRRLPASDAVIPNRRAVVMTRPMASSTAASDSSYSSAQIGVAVHPEHQLGEIVAADRHPSMPMPTYSGSQYTTEGTSAITNDAGRVGGQRAGVHQSRHSSSSHLVRTNGIIKCRLGFCFRAPGRAPAVPDRTGRGC